MTTKDLAYFLEVCRQGSINAAARELYITTQGLSKILQKLEVELGYPILVRTQTGVTLTDDGKNSGTPCPEDFAADGGAEL